MTRKKQSFEKAMKQLEQIVQELEKGDLPLEHALNRFEQGVQLAGFCSKTLDETENKVTVLLKDKNGTVVERPFLDDEPSVE